MRKVATVVIAADNRDKGKTFVITEMPASRAEKWATRALIAISRAGVDMPDDIAAAGMAGLAVVGFQAITRVAFADAEPLLDEMMACAVFVPNPAQPLVFRDIREDDVEEVSTLAKLRDEVVHLHTGFSPAAELSRLATAAGRSARAREILSDTRTSEATSGPS